jgi:hypothetical protein
MPSALETKSMTGEVNGMTISACPKVTLLISLVVLPAARSGNCSTFCSSSSGLGLRLASSFDCNA